MPVHTYPVQEMDFQFVMMKDNARFKGLQGTEHPKRMLRGMEGCETLLSLTQNEGVVLARHCDTFKGQEWTVFEIFP